MLCSCTGVAYYRRFTGESCIAEFATQYQSYIANRKFCIANCDAIQLNSCLGVVQIVLYGDVMSMALYGGVVQIALSGGVMSTAVYGGVVQIALYGGVMILQETDN